MNLLGDITQNAVNITNKIWLDSTNSLWANSDIHITFFVCSGMCIFFAEGTTGDAVSAWTHLCYEPYFCVAKTTFNVADMNDSSRLLQINSNGIIQNEGNIPANTYVKFFAVYRTTLT